MRAENIAAYIQEATTGRGPAAPSLAYEPVDDAVGLPANRGHVVGLPSV